MNRRPPHPYARRHLADHAIAGDRPEVALNLETLPYLDQAHLATRLRLAQLTPDTDAWRVLGAWQTVRHRWSWEDPDANAAALDVAYLAAGGAAVPPRSTRSGLTAAPLWVEWLSGGTIAAGDARGTVRIILGSVHGAPLLVTAEVFGVRLWEPGAGRQLGEPLVPPGQVYAIAMADKQGWLAAACAGGRVVVWDVITGLEVTTVDVPDQYLRGIAIGELAGDVVVAAGGQSGEVHVHRLPDRGLIRVLPGDAAVRDIALETGPDGALHIAVGYGDGWIVVHDVGSDVAGRRFPLGPEINAVALAVDRDLGRLLLAGGSADGQARIWDVHSGQPVTDPLPHSDGEVRSVAMATGQQRLLATGTHGRGAHVWSVDDGVPAGPPLWHPAPVESVAFGEIDGRLMLATACLDGNTRLWDPVRPSAPRAPVEAWCASVAVDAEVVAAGLEGGSVRLWDRVTGAPYPAFWVEPGDEPAVKAMRAPEVRVRLGDGPAGRILTTQFQGRITAWDIQDLRLPVPLDGAPAGRLEPVDVVDGHPLLARVDDSGAVSVVDLVEDAVRGHPLRQVADRVAFVPVSNPLPATVLLALQTSIGLRLVDPWTGVDAFRPLAIPIPEHAAVARLDGTDVLAALDSDRLRLFDLHTGTPAGPEIATSTYARGVAWAWIDDRELLVTAHFATVRIWNPRLGRLVFEVPFGTEIAGMAVHQAALDRATVVVGGPGVVVLELRAAPRVVG
jgi:WD40 repeat protein